MAQNEKQSTQKRADASPASKPAQTSPRTVAPADAPQAVTAPGLTAATFPKEREVRVQGFVLKLPIRFQPGLVADEAMALFINSAHQGAALNAFGDRAKALKDAGVDKYNTEKGTNHTDIQAVLQSELTSYYNDYSWSPRGTAEVLDPVEREMRKIARNEFQLAVSAAGRTLVGVPKEQVDAALDAYIEKNRDRLRSDAEARINKATNLVGQEFLDQLIAPPKADAAA